MTLDRQQLSTPFSLSAPNGAARLTIDGASVVNGAQTVVAISEAVKKNPAAAAARVGVRVIVVREEATGLATTITQTTNTQNDVELRDFVVLDPVQTDIRDDFALTLDKTYVIKRGEIDPPPEGGCSVVHASIALACAYPDVELAVRAKKDTALLWERDPKGAYTLLFGGRRPSALRIWRCVQTLRAVQQSLLDSRDDRRGRAQAVAEHGDLLIAHIVFAKITLDGVDDPDVDWSARLADVPELVRQTIGWLVLHIDVHFSQTAFIGSTLTSTERCKTLVELVLRNIASPQPEPTLPDAYSPPKAERRSRRPNSVGVLVDANRIGNGARLVFSTASKAEERAIGSWLAANPRRAEATWTPSRSRPLVWAADGHQYAPSGLVMEMWRQAGWKRSPVSVQGPARWSLPGEGSLAELAEAVLRANEPD
ncbi:AIPR protein [Frankia torreyi]|uniref:AIPR protein n=1 Tax=Frankia torreyi TaxID=1856 RepID=A0A0D8BL75_9ACTN|nr:MULTISPECIES: AIPR family protein [Frankia]KJE24855.1 AIPR protein [Frankia torreyi]